MLHGGGFGFKGPVGDLERFGFDDMRGAGSDAEKVGIGYDAEGLVILDDAGLAVPVGVLRKQGAELRRKRERRLEYVRVFPW